MKKIITASMLSLLLGGTVQAQSLPVYLDDSKPIEDRIEDALSRITVEEKVALIHAQSKFSSPGVARLGIPEFWMTDGPHGIRPEVLWDEWNQAGWTNDSCVAFPALTCLAATWNPKAALLYGQSIGEEARYRNKTVLLGPGVNIYRTPLNGRNFEYMGEDPYLASQMVVPYVKGVQQNGVAACVKHYALNNQEINRHTTNVIVDDRALYEIYLPAFKAAVQEGKAWAIMGSYNLYKNQHNCHNRYLLNDILKGEWGFDGVVVSDWGGVHNTEEAIYNGMDMEFGSWTNGLSKGMGNAYDNYYLAHPYLKQIKEGKIGTKELDDKVRRILRLAFRTTMNRNRPYGAMLSEEHIAAARKIGEEGIVLLQNKKNILPIDLNRTKKIAVIGENALKMMTVGGGSSSLKVQYECSPLDGIKRRIGDGIEISYARGYVGDTGGQFDGVSSGQNLKDDRSARQLIEEAVRIAQSADYVIFIGGLNKSGHQDCEDTDRKGLELPYKQDKVIGALAKVNKNLIVVNISGNAVAMPWISEVPAVIQAWYLGTEAGNAIASVLVGDVNPSGKLPFTFPEKLEDVGAHQLGDYPGRQREDGIFDEKYNESIFVGYRWTDKQKIRPLFPFGHGLSYTTFAYGKATVNKKVMKIDEQIAITVPITNTGKRIGSEIVQLYISDLKSSLPRPVKELKGFSKIQLAPGETQEVTFLIDKQALSFFNDSRHEWVAEPGKFEAQIAASATDIKSKVTFELE
ncbi:glycosyl hydrolase family 3 C-terminal domain protein [Bacteroides fragilis str. 3719 A10]|uniref:Glycosyl hydrolase family 3 C-terminal domain protein n=2 Tax=Bacteroides fragilis TaxID=817 RepID=A0AB73AG70_BACFG|nr:glycosyl hydrolase family 3 C-terminal domain protein [Bacteroides fragilis str. 3774 T13]EXY45037.1 glycosyl hydrolase family 3 C-terminal domain protein [Bacteroides fragilis str. 3783N1-2]EXY49853.1 glycosyl hydrolase family 3 C-terminal domain protein [Bacteroides fragilis str. 3783N2-1]EXY54536.1 glycosyl hydrolase family 3 C-terminal domain protein [Bacteroides fragilis str. 3976T7]EXZ56736.1 glycosyl hydrolase family 3 C-terminal domain protein [Bacteroides fragilis str. 3719 A10]EXZ